MNIDIEVNDADLARFTSKLDGLAAAVDDELTSAMGDITLRVEATAMRLAPVDTGHLRRSISSEVEAHVGDVVEGVVGSNTEYAPIQEIRNSYVRKAFDMERDYMKRRVQRAFRTAVQRVS